MKIIYFKIMLSALLLVCLNLSAQYVKKGHVVAGLDCAFGVDSAHLIAPLGLCVNNAGDIYVADESNNRVQLWKKGAKYGTTVAGQANGRYVIDSTTLYFATDIFMDTANNIYVVDQRHNRVQKWIHGYKYGITVAGQKSGAFGSDSTVLSFPYGVFVDSKGNVYVSDQSNNRVQKWAPGAKYGVTVAGQANCVGGADSAHLSSPDNIFVDKTGNIYVLDHLNNRVQKWAPGAKYGVTVAGQKSGAYGSDSASLYQPFGMLVDATGNIYIGDYFNNRVQKWAPGAKYGTTVIPATTKCDTSGVYSPSGLFMDFKGNLYVSESVARIVVKFDKYGASVNNVIDNHKPFKIYPNPASNGEFSINMKSGITAQEAYINIYNILGQQVYEQPVISVNGIINAKIIYGKLASGLYIVKLNVGGEIFTSHLEIVK